MGTIMTKCPKTGKAVATGMASDKASFEAGQWRGNTFGGCPACGGTHTWNKEDAWIDEREV